MARRARRTGSVFWGCSRYPKCDFTTSREPLGPVHDVDGGPVARRDEHAALCLKCGAPVALPDGPLPPPGTRLPGGEPDPAALARPSSRGGRRGAAAGGRTRASQPAAPRPRRAAAGGDGAARHGARGTPTTSRSTTRGDAG